MNLFLGVDGGGTGCRVVLANGQGHVLARAEGGAANIASSPETALANILTATRAAATQAFGDGAEGALPRIRAGLGLAGANAAGAAGWLGTHLPFAQSRIETDAITAVKGALGRADGIVAAMGTGSVFAIQQAGQIRQIGGWGFWLGDEGSGAVLGRTLLSRALRALDGALPMTPLLRTILDEFTTPDRLVTFSLTARPGDYAAFAPRLWTSDDPAAQAILTDALTQVRDTIVALQPTPALPVTFIGGLGPAYAAHLTDWPQSPAKGTALDGALQLAMEDA